MFWWILVVVEAKFEGEIGMEANDLVKFKPERGHNTYNPFI